MTQQEKAQEKRERRQARNLRNQRADEIGRYDSLARLKYEEYFRRRQCKSC
jgi:hypothetical protein